jgi:hypothetical protein
MAGSVGLDNNLVIRLLVVVVVLVVIPVMAVTVNLTVPQAWHRKLVLAAAAEVAVWLIIIPHRLIRQPHYCMVTAMVAWVVVLVRMVQVLTALQVLKVNKPVETVVLVLALLTLKVAAVVVV